MTVHRGRVEVSHAGVIRGMEAFADFVVAGFGVEVADGRAPETEARDGNVRLPDRAEAEQRHALLAGATTPLDMMMLP